ASASCRTVSTVMDASLLAVVHTWPTEVSMAFLRSAGISSAAATSALRASRQSRITGEIWDREPPPIRSRTWSLVGLSLPSPARALAAAMILSLMSALIFIWAVLCMYCMYVPYIQYIPIASTRPPLLRPQARRAQRLGEVARIPRTHRVVAAVFHSPGTVVLVVSVHRQPHTRARCGAGGLAG